MISLMEGIDQGHTPKIHIPLIYSKQTQKEGDFLYS